ncbi:hypothetical protein T4A_13513 [Trichinella pseudospiralis]|uniref:Uncharacterized protein n=1 Tax=Trichinella pseudospiralis TaxID=6337 RepID=A0A0V1ERU9_TRIPS|nr:hypothetical protein T4A_13513 [Trichinella pseudospiralis]
MGLFCCECSELPTAKLRRIERVAPWIVDRHFMTTMNASIVEGKFSSHLLIDSGAVVFVSQRSVGYRGTISTNFEETSVILIGDYTPYCSGDRHALSPQDAFSCIFSSDQIDVIVRNTNRKAVFMQADH